MKKNSLILVVDDENQIHKFLKIALESHDYRICQAYSVREGLEKAVSESPDLIILDLGLPDGSGMSILTSVREWSQLPIIILSVRNDESTVIEALDAGADDYLKKPFTIGELLARIRVCLRRSQKSEDTPVFQSDSLEVDLSARVVKVEGEEVKLTSTEYDLLAALVRHQGKVVTHSQLLREVWGPHSTNQTQYLRVYISHLRQKIESNPGNPRLIVTEPGVGYRLRIL